MATRGIVAAYRARLTSTNRCGLPTNPGTPADDDDFLSYTFDAFVSVASTVNMTEAQEQTSTKANGDDCTVFKTEPKLRDETVTLTLCGVDDYVLSFLSTVTTVVDESADPEGYFTERISDPNRAFALELWNNVGNDAECPDTPENDSYFQSAASTATAIGYHVWPAITGGAITGDITYGLETANLVITGTAKFAPLWGRGPYEVRTNATTGAPGRLLVPFSADRTSWHGKTLLAAPDIDDAPRTLTRPTPYFGAVTP